MATLASSVKQNKQNLVQDGQHAIGRKGMTYTSIEYVAAQKPSSSTDEDGVAVQDPPSEDR